MITEEVKNLFAFINFLHNETAYFLSKKPLINELLELDFKRSALKPNENYKDRIEFNKVQAEIEQKFDVVEPQTTAIISNKALELSIATLDNHFLVLSNRSTLCELQRNFEECDLLQIIEAKQKYLEFRTQTDCHYFLQMFFYDLDRDLTEFFLYFNESSQNELEVIAPKVTYVKSLGEAFSHKGGGIISFPFPIGLDEKLTDKRENQSGPIDTSHATKLTAPIIRRFCELCNNSGLDKKDPNESVIPYCERICLKFGLEYRDRVRQHFDFNNEPKPTDKYLKKVIELILPRLKAIDRAIIDSYIKPK